MKYFDANEISKEEVKRFFGLIIPAGVKKFLTTFNIKDIESSKIEKMIKNLKVTSLRNERILDKKYKNYVFKPDDVNFYISNDLEIEFPTDKNDPAEIKIKKLNNPPLDLLFETIFKDALIMFLYDELGHRMFGD